MNYIKKNITLPLLKQKEKYIELFSLTENEENTLCQITSNKAERALKYFAIIAIVLQSINIMRVLVISTVKLQTLNNRIYFTLYISLLTVSIVALILVNKYKGKVKAINRLSTYVTSFWIVWMLLLNSYDAYNTYNLDVAIYLTGIFGSSIIVQMKPKKVMYIYIASFFLFVLVNNKFLDIGIIINVGAAMMLACLSSILIYIYTIRDIKQKENIMNINEKLSVDYEKLRLSMEKYEIILRESSEGIFEWNIEKDSIIFSSDLVKKFQYEPVVYGVKTWIEQHSKIHPNSKQKVLDQIEYAYNKKTNCEVEFYHEGEETYNCYLLKLVLQYNAESRPINAIGVLSDITFHKKIITKLEQKAEKDLLTNVYNKMTLEKKSQNFMKHAMEDDIFVMMIFDIDDFKQINDTYGHPCGDQVLISIATIIKSQFRHSDLVGRLGGDEFCLVMKMKIGSLIEIEQNALCLLDKIRNLTLHNYEGVKVACSIGISVEWSKKINFPYLYTMADEALYEAKKLGKNRSYIKNMIDKISE